MIAHANGIDIYYEQSGQGRPFLLLHGNGESHAIFDGLAAALKARYCVYALDTRCHGKSTQTAAISYRDMMEDVAAFIVTLGLDRPLVLGFSDGAITGILLAIHYPRLLSGLISCGANTRPSQLSRWFLFFSKLGYRVTKDPRLKMMYTEPDISDEELATIEAPVLVLAGTRDVIPVPVTKAIAAAIPQSEVRILEGQTHTSYIRHPERVLAAMGPFLGRQAGV